MLSKATIKYIQSLQQKKVRNELKLFVAEGTVMLTEMLEEGCLEAVQVYATAGWWETVSDELKSKYKTIVEIIEDFQLAQMSGRETAVGGLAVFKQKSNSIAANYKDEVVIALADLQDPGNLGTIIRTADWFGIKNIICSENTVDCYNSKVVQSSMGSVGRINIHYVDLHSWLSKTEIPIYAARIDGEDIKQSERVGEAVILIGNEAKGIPLLYESLTCKSITIKKIGKSESLNAAVAASILMYEFCSGN